MFDTILASVQDHETGSASGVLNAGQQLATSIGVAVFGTIFFDTISFKIVGGHFHRALTYTLELQVALCVVLILISPLLPRFAREQAPVETAAEPVSA
jgi:formate hydrogenlyase subunit 4